MDVTLSMILQQEDFQISGVAALVASVCLAVCNLSSDTDAASSTAAAASSVAGLRMTMMLFPIAGLLLAVWLFHKKYLLTDEKVEELASEIRMRREADDKRIY